VHSWAAGDCVVWDNRCTLHAPSHFDAAESRRLMWRLTILGPQLRPAPAELAARL
jgi:alpha-ketoglutarate-dependent taurine dioxygenase